MKRGFARATLLGCVALWPLGARLLAGDNPVKDTTDFTSIDYCDPPNQMKMSSRLSGVEGRPVSENVMIIKQMKLEVFDTNGLPKYIVEAPECRYDRSKDTATSAGPIKLRQADNRLVLTGVGFSWVHDTNAGLLVISNQVRTVVATEGSLKTTP